MHSRWNEAEAASLGSDLERCVYASRLLGQDPDLVLHGGGNTSVKVAGDLMYVKGSGADLATITAEGFAPVRLAPLRALLGRGAMSDRELAGELRAATTPLAPAPSVEALLHALIPHPFVAHTHADALATLMNTPSGEERVRDLYRDDVAVVPYHMPGFRLARACADLLPGALGPGTLGVVLLGHGLFTFGETAREAYERMIGLVTRAEEALVKAGAWKLPLPDPAPAPAPLRELLAGLRLEVSRAAGRPMILTCPPDPEALAFARRGDVARVASRGPATPDHVLYTRRVPLLGRDVAGYAGEYRREFGKYTRTLAHPPAMLDPAPRVILDPAFGLAAAGRSAREAGIALDLYRHTLRMIGRAERLERWEALPARDLFDMEYWELEQAKLAAGPPPPLAGAVVLLWTFPDGDVERELLALGAAVVRLGGPPRGSAPPAEAACLELNLDATDPAALDAGLEEGARRFGGLDAVVAPAAARDNPPEVLLDRASPLLRLAPARARAAIRSLLVARAEVALWTLDGKDVRPGPHGDESAQAAEWPR